MCRLVSLLCFARILCMSVLADSGPEETAATARKTIAVVVIGQPLEKDVLEDLTLWLHKNLSCPVRVKPLRSVLKDDPVLEAEDLQRTLEPDEVCLLAMLNIPEKVTFQEGVFPTKNVGLLNVRALDSVEANTPEAKTKYMRLVQKQAISVIARTLGMHDCPNPHCALFKCENKQQLQAKGRNLCPPCEAEFEKVLKNRVQRSSAK